MINSSIKYNFVLIFFIILVVFLYSIYYMSNVDTLMNIIRNLSNDNDISITKIDVIAFNGFDRYNYSLVEKNYVQEFISKLNEIKLSKPILGNLFANKVYTDLYFENYLISLYEKDRLVASIQIIRKDVMIEGITNDSYNYRIVNYSNIDLKMLYHLVFKYGKVINK